MNTKNKIRWVMHGALGRMGRQILAGALSDSDLCLAGAIESKESALLGQDVGLLLGQQALGVKISADLSDLKDRADVVIDFSGVQAALSVGEWCAKLKIPLVVGTTGFSEDEDRRLRDLMKGTVLVKAPNMSVGVNVLFKLVKEAAKILGREYDIEIIEAHHRMKKDAPSGTAKGILEAIVSGLNKNMDVVSGREGLVGERRNNEIGVFAVRAGDIVGDHTVLMAGHGERLELIHRAHNREPFASGALRAAKFAVKAKPGFYNMQDVLGIQ